MNSVAQAEDRFVVLYGISWETYEKILDALGHYKLRHTYDRGALELRSLLYGVAWEDYLKFLDATPDLNIRHTYDKGALEFMSPRKDHDWVKRLLGRMIEYMTLRLGLYIQSIGSTTLTGDHVERGLQPDESYYLANEPLVRGKATYEPGVDPPPDLVVEVDVTHSSLPRMSHFADLGIPEVWRHDGELLIFYHRREGGEYVESSHSASFPFLTAADAQRFLDQAGQLDENSLIRSFGDWACEAASQIEGEA